MSAEAGAVDPARRQCLIVLGMHRSGTSAVTRVSSFLGFDLPPDVVPANDANPTGYWESIAAYLVNEALLAAAGSSWADLREFRIDRLTAAEVAGFRVAIQQMIGDKFGTSTRFVIKDPRINHFAGLYADALADIGVQTRFVIMFRNPLDVVASLGKRENFPATFTELLWLRNTLAAEQQTRGHARVFVDYADLMIDPRDTAESIARLCGLPGVGEEPMLEIAGFISPALQHHRTPAAEIGVSSVYADVVGPAFQACQTLASDPEHRRAQDSLDAIRAIVADFDPGFQDALSEIARRTSALVEELWLPEVNADRTRASAAHARLAVNRDELARVARVAAERNLAHLDRMDLEFL